MITRLLAVFVLFTSVLAPAAGQFAKFPSSKPQRVTASLVTPGDATSGMVFQSTGFTPAARTRTSTSPGPGVGSGTSSIRITPGSPNSFTMIACILRRPERCTMVARGLARGTISADP